MILVGAVLLAAFSVGQSAPNPPSPPRMRSEMEAVAPVVPPEFRFIITAATREQLTVRSLDGGSIPVDISGSNAWDYRLYQRGRYLGIRLSGYEVVGYLLVDRAARAENVIKTGSEPLFSGDSRWVAAVGITDADQGNFEAIGLWEVGTSTTTRRFSTNAVPLSSDW